MPRGKESQGGSRGSQSSNEGKSKKDLAAASEATKKEVSKKGSEASKGGGRGKSSSTR